MKTACVAKTAATAERAGDDPDRAARPFHRSEQVVADERHDREREDDAGADGEGLGERQRPEQLPFLVGEEEHRDERDERVRDGRDDRAADFARALEDRSGSDVFFGSPVAT